MPTMYESFVVRVNEKIMDNRAGLLYFRVMGARYIIAKFGGRPAFARALSEFNGRAIHPATVQYWDVMDRFPASRQKEVVDLAERMGVSITLEEFVLPSPSEVADEAQN